jgi:hypothetical protein
VANSAIFQSLRKNNGGTIKIQGDHRINDLVDKHVTINYGTSKIHGYRVRVYSDLGRDSRAESLEVQQNIEENYKDIPVYRNYKAPYFKVYAGDFRTKDDAFRFLQKIKPHYPKAFIVYTAINYPKLY